MSVCLIDLRFILCKGAIYLAKKGTDDGGIMIDAARAGVSAGQYGLYAAPAGDDAGQIMKAVFGKRLSISRMDI